MRTYFFIIAVVFGFLFQGNVLAQSPDSTRTNQHFDLILFGRNLKASKSAVWLKTNPWLSDKWEKLENTHSQTTSRYNLLTYQDLPVNRYLGQDIRENYLLIKIQTAKDGTSISAIYVLPHSNNFDVQKIFALIKEDPIKLQQHSLANYVRPRPYLLKGSQAFIEHVEAPVRNLKPGVQEVKWLDILFSH